VETGIGNPCPRCGALLPASSSSCAICRYPAAAEEATDAWLIQPSTVDADADSLPVIDSSASAESIV
jgi:hypothetical protein